MNSALYVRRFSLNLIRDLTINLSLLGQGTSLHAVNLFYIKDWLEKLH